MDIEVLIKASYTLADSISVSVDADMSAVEDVHIQSERERMPEEELNRLRAQFEGRSASADRTVRWSFCSVASRTHRCTCKQLSATTKRSATTATTGVE